MAYQKLQAGKAWSVYPSDNTDIPNTSVVGPTGTNTSTSATQLIDSAATFLNDGIKVGDIIVNSTDGTQATVVSVSSDTTIEVSASIFNGGTAKAYTIYGGNQQGAVMYCGVAGNIKVTTVAGDDVTFVGINTGAFIPVQVKKIFSTGTTATNIIALW